jgi:hypothetical protein
LQGFSGENRKKLPFSTENNFGSQPKTVSDDNRKPFRFSTENNFGSQPKTVSDESRKQLPVSTEADCRLRRDSEGVLEPLEVHTHIADKKEALMPEFEPLDRKCAPRLRPKIAEEMIEYCKGKILAVETARTPQPMAKEQISAYRARIKAVKAWSAGAL